MEFKLIQTDGSARAGEIRTAHSVIQTPVFMPVGTVGSVKSLDAKDLMALLDAAIILGNTYHLYLRPGSERVQKMGGLHGFTRYTRSFLTDSGGFQAFSLSDISKADQGGIHFKSHIDGSAHYFTPEKVIDIQHALGSDIMMVLDDLIELPATPERLKLSVERTIGWAAASLAHHTRRQAEGVGQQQNLFAIVQGGVDLPWRARCAEALAAMEGFDGYAIGGLSVGESNTQMYDTVAWTAPLLPLGKPRYLMGVGTPEDLIENIRRGIDMFDCVMPTRNARNGTLFTTFGKLSIKSSRYAEEEGPIDPACTCYTCHRYSRSYLHHLFRAKEMTYYRLASLHNLHYYLTLMREVRAAILQECFEAYRADFYHKRAPS